MRALILFLLILMSYPTLFAQDSTLAIVKAGTRIKDVLPLSDVFSYPQFVTGKVFYKNGLLAAAKMNYNSLSDQMLFIDPKGDTLALDNEKTINFIAVDKDTFYYADGYLRLVASNSVIRLAERKVWQVADVRRIGSHNRPATGYNVTAMRSVTDDVGRTYELVQDADVTLRKRPHYYFGDAYSFVPASKKSLLTFFSKKENMLAGYLKENKVNYNKRQDLEKLAQFLEQNY